MRKIVLLCLLLSFNVQAFVGADSIQRAPSLESCSPELHVCLYKVKNLASASALKSKIMPIMFPGMPLDPQEGFVKEDPNNKKELRYWFTNDELRERFISLAHQLDRFEQFTPSALVMLTTEIYAVTDEGLTTLQASIGLSSGTVAPDMPASVDPGFSMSLGVGNWVLSAALTAARTLNQIEKVTTIKQIIPNLTHIDFNQTTSIFVSPTPGISQEQIAGLKLDGEVSIVETDDTNKVLIKDFDFYYGVEEVAPDETTSRVNALKFKRSETLLTEGISRVMVSVNEYLVGRRLSVGFPTSVNNQKRSTKLMVITRARAVSFDDFERENQQIRQMSARGKFTAEEVASFPTNSVEMEDVAESLIPYVKLTLDGSRVLGFRLSKELARKSNIKKTLKIKIRGKNYRQDALRTVEELMLTGLKLDEKQLDPLMRRPVVKFKIRMKEFNRFGVYPYRSKIYFNPETNEFIR